MHKQKNDAFGPRWKNAGTQASPRSHRQPLIGLGGTAVLAKPNHQSQRTSDSIDPVC